MQIIPVTNDASQVFRTTIGGQSVRVRLAWSDAAEAWFFSMDGFANGALVHSGVPLMRSILTDFVGDVIAISTVTPEQEVGRNSWNDTHTLIYLTEAEAEANLL